LFQQNGILRSELFVPPEVFWIAAPRAGRRYGWLRAGSRDSRQDAGATSFIPFGGPKGAGPPFAEAAPPLRSLQGWESIFRNLSTREFTRHIPVATWPLASSLARSPRAIQRYRLSALHHNQLLPTPALAGHFGAA